LWFGVDDLDVREHGNEGGVQTLWEVLYAAGAELVLNGHDHSYERFAPQDPWGRVDATFGIREFVNVKTVVVR